MKTKLITCISLILVVSAGCQKKEAAAPQDPAAGSTAARASASGGNTTEATPAAEETPATPPMATLSEVAGCSSKNNPIWIDALNPGGYGNLGDTCVTYNSGTANTGLTWKWKTTSNVTFKVEFTFFSTIEPPPHTYPPYNLSANCPGTANTCLSGNLLSGATYGTAYYKVTTNEVPPRTFNGRIIIQR